MKPLILLNASHLASRPPGSASIQVKSSYAESVARAGGVPFVAPPLEANEHVSRLVERADGVMLLGGPDILPTRYGAAASPMAQPMAPQRDAFDFALLAEALAQEKPVLAICLGCQELNVHYGGTLWQDLPSERPDSELRHGREINAGASRHRVSIEADTLLGRILGPGEIEVNSTHHQAVRAIGHGLIAPAHAPDGIVEAVEDPSRPFVLGVQWHPEDLPESRHAQALFSAFIEAAARRKA